ncbi:hypothetical protein [Streptosporangium pseudovulgare]|uniref:Uncharacterized protein n=1 Tax=Streptosporangium pseudovulgare TaxID=35765 RepID=A0ABQ2R2W4_9ACTN|nr:hypothetical protein [Streptosporangium pseudovulgare]GGQ07350.1 hypothetical protein GCM10010140_41970 [Streptosporangium pseudovulgare]
MTAPGASTTNTADGSAYVGTQAGTVHGDVNTYMTFADASPRDKFETGVRCLDGDMAERARQLIDEAFMAGYHTDRVRFYRLLALVSGRTRRELSKEEVAMLQNAQSRRHITGDDEWAKGLTVLHRLLDSAGKSDVDSRVLMKKVDALGPLQRTLILRHLESFLEGSLKDQIWHQVWKLAETERMTGDRVSRVWKFFEPSPTRPQARNPQPAAIPPSVWVQAVAATAVLAGATVHIGYLLVQAGRIAALLAYLLSIIGGFFGVRDGVEWRFRVVRRRTKDKEYGTPRQRATNAPPDGFARQVDHRFDYYFAKYVPRGVDRDFWLATTAGIRRSIRDEVVEVYREKRIGVEKIAWLIRHRAGDAKKHWEKGTLWSYREELATPPSAKAVTLLGSVVFVAGGLWAVGGAVSASPLSAVCSTSIALASGWIAARAWLHIILERRRYAADTVESMQVKETDEAALARWRAKLADKPKDREMAAWLDCDRKVLLNEALQHYRLKISDVIAHAFIETPAASGVRARVRNGPWRYKKYQLLIFLLTTDGVREITAALDFDQGSSHILRRANYRFETIAAVRVSQGNDGGQVFELALVNGQEVRVKVTEPETEELQQGEEPGTVFEATLDASGLRRTLHVLEGIAAEGKRWITQEHRREGKERGAA